MTEYFLSFLRKQEFTLSSRYGYFLKNPCFWIPAYAGMTKLLKTSISTTALVGHYFLSPAANSV
jgi:hypothetical protein